MKKTSNNSVKRKLLDLGYKKTNQTEWHKNDRKIYVPSSGYYNTHLRITWKEKWKNDYAVVYDFSKGDGPICVVPILELFNTDFVREKRQEELYKKSGFWWTQTFSLDKPLAQFVLGYKDRWDIL
jgi:hypothetical protein